MQGRRRRSCREMGVGGDGDGWSGRVGMGGSVDDSVGMNRVKLSKLPLPKFVGGRGVGGRIFGF